MRSPMRSPSVSSRTAARTALSSLPSGGRSQLALTGETSTLASHALRQHGGVDDEHGAQLAELAELVDLISDGDVVVLSGAGISTDSGIPDYRGPTGATRTAAPMTYQTFTRDPVARRRYWARSHRGGGLIARARPNAGPHSVASWRDSMMMPALVTL